MAHVRKHYRGYKPANTRAPAPQKEKSKPPNTLDLLDFLALTQQCGVSFMPIRLRPELPGLGRGISGLVAQTAGDVYSEFALKSSVPEETRYTNDNRYRPLMSEIRVLQHDMIKTHPNIIRLVGITWDIELRSLTTWPVLITKKARYGELDSSLFSEDSPIELDFEAKVRICAGILDGLGALHFSGIAHGDLKLDNVLLDEEEGALVPKLIDFGSTCFEGQEHFVPVISLPWNSPEITTETSFSVADIAASDMYSFGLLLSQILLPAQNLSTADLLFTRQQPHPKRHVMIENTNRLKKAGSLGHKLMEVCLVLPKTQSDIVSEIIGATVLGDPRKRMAAHELKQRFFSTYTISSDATRIEPVQSAESQCTTLVPSSPNSCTHATFDIVKDFGELDAADYLLRQNIFRCLSSKSKDTSAGCPGCARAYAFQLALCYRLAFGVSRDDKMSELWLQTSCQDDDCLKQALAAVRELYQPSGRLSEPVRKSLTSGILLTENNSGRYLAQGRIKQAECALLQEVSGRVIELGEQHLSTATLQTELSAVCDHLGQREQAHTILRNVIATRRLKQGTGHPHTLSSMAELAGSLAGSMQYTSAIKLFREVLSKWQSANHPDALNIKYSLGLALIMACRWGEAEKLFHQVMREIAALFGSTHHWTPRAALGLVFSLQMQGKVKDAESLLSDITAEAIGGGKSMYGAFLIVRRSILCYELGRMHESKTLAEKAVLEYTKHFGEAHSLTTDAVALLAEILGDMGHVEDGERLLRNIIANRKPGPAVLGSLQHECSLARILFRQGKYIEAESLASSTRSSGPQFPEIFLSSTELVAGCQMRTGKHNDARNTWEELVRSCKQTFTEKSHWTVGAMGGLGSCLFEIGERSSASTVLSSALELGRSIGGLAIVTFRIAMTLGVAYERQGKFHDSESVHRDIITEASNTLGEHHPDTVRCRINLALCYIYRHNHRAAAEILTACMESLPEGDEQIFSMVNLKTARSTLLQRQGHIEEATKLVEEALETCQSIRGPDHPTSVALSARLIGIRMSASFTRGLELEALENIRTSERVLGSQHQVTLKAKSYLAEAYLRCGRHDDAELLFLELDPFMDREDDQLLVATMCARRADYFLRRGQKGKAVELEERALHIRATILGPESPVTLVSMSNLASVFASQENYEPAERLLKTVVNVREAHTGSASLATLKSKLDLASVQFLQGNRVDSERMVRTVVEGYTSTLGEGARETQCALALLKKVASERSEDCRPALYEGARTNS